MRAAWLALLPDPRTFRLRMTRRLFSRGRLLRERSWDETLPRDLQ